MVILRVKLKGRKVINQHHPNRASAMRTKKFIGRSGTAQILTDSGKISKPRRKR